MAALHVDFQVEGLARARPRREPDRDAGLLVRADDPAAPEREARRRRRRHGEEAARAADAVDRAERRQARDAGAPGRRREPRGSRAAGARAQGGGAAAASGARHAGAAAPEPAGRADRLAAAARGEDRVVPLREGSHQGAVLGGAGAGEDRRGRDGHRPRHAGHRHGDPARARQDRGAAGARVGDRGADRVRRARGRHRQPHAARPRALADLRVGPGRGRAREAEGGGRRRATTRRRSSPGTPAT